MKADFRSLTVVALAGLLASAIARSAAAGDLGLALHFEPESASHYVAVTNNSRRFLCVAEHVFDTKRGYISLSDMNDGLAPARSHADSAPALYRGVDLASAYIFLRPGERRKMYIDLTNFITREGRYRYRILFPYYDCNDIIDTRRGVEQRQVPEQVVDASGELEVVPENKD